jgi:hypothetical protein
MRNPKLYRDLGPEADVRLFRRHAQVLCLYGDVAVSAFFALPTCVRVLIHDRVEDRGRSHTPIGSPLREEMRTVTSISVTGAIEDLGAIDLIKTNFSSAHERPPYRLLLAWGKPTPGRANNSRPKYLSGVAENLNEVNPLFPITYHS